jgi:hypothetical protein
VGQYFTVDVLSKIAFGKAFGCLPAGVDMYDYVSTSHEFIPILELKLNHSWIQWITTTRPFLKLVAPRHTDKVGMGKVMGYVELCSNSFMGLGTSRVNPTKHRKGNCGPEICNEGEVRFIISRRRHGHD